MQFEKNIRNVNIIYSRIYDSTLRQEPPQYSGTNCFDIFLVN